MFLQSSLLAIGMALFQSSTMADTSFDLDIADKYVHFSGAAYCAHPRFKKDQIENW
jgi:hypothetical protein